MNKEIEKILLKVEKPGRYIGGELNSVMKNSADVDIRFAFCFPDTYEIGMSHLGIKILYSLINERVDCWCERVFAPWQDMEKQMRDNNIPLFALESGDAIRNFDIIGFTIQYELCYTNILNMLDLAGLPVRSKDRDSLSPLIIAGGPCVCNAEPIADFIDLFELGEGEVIMPQLLDLYKKHKNLGSTKAEFLREAAKIEGVYVPSLYDIAYNDDGTIKSITPKDTAPAKVKKAIVKDLDKVYYPDKFIVPLIEIVHDRVAHEIFRGCIRGCRFCQAGFIYRPVREKSPDTINAQSRLLCKNTGYDEVSLISLSSSDYTQIKKLLMDMVDWTDKDNVNIALPSLRADNFDAELVKKLAGVRKSGLTFAAEAGTQRLRDVINKNVTDEDVLSSARDAFAGGWTGVKLYFMMGLPTETDEDLQGIIDLSANVIEEYFHTENRPKGKFVTVSSAVSTFVPKPFTPFQWEPQIDKAEIDRRKNYLNTALLADRTNSDGKTVSLKNKVTLKYHDTDTSALEAVFARGDRRLADAIELAWKKGCTFDSWGERLVGDLWDEAFREAGLDPAFYAYRERSYDEIFPWDHMDVGISKAFLISENKKAHEGVTTPHCRIQCAGCGAAALCDGKCDGRDKK